jgi:plasmid stabilization system protein ParE
MATRSLAHALRQHHAIEHATVTLLSRRLPGVRMLARSDLQGFTLFGEADTDAVEAAAEEAVKRLQAGEAGLAVHPNCGTNLVTAGMLSGLAAVVATSGRGRSWADRVPSSLLAATLALILAVPAGRWMQENVTTSPHVEGLRIASVTRLGGPMTAHRVIIG